MASELTVSKKTKRLSGPAKVITFGNKKGGVGKTCFTIHTAGILDRYGYRVLIIDQDTQKSVYGNFKRREKSSTGPSFDYRYQTSKLLQNEISDLRNLYDFILIDSPPGTSDAAGGKEMIRESTVYAFMVSDLVVIPFKLGSSDIDSGLSYVSFLKQHMLHQLKTSGRCPQAIVVPNLLVTGRVWAPRYSAVKDAILRKDPERVSVSDIIIWNYADYDNPQFLGQTAADLPRSKARVLFEKLVFEKFCGPLGVPDRRPKREANVADLMVRKTWDEVKGAV